MITCFISCWETATIFNYDFVYFTCNIVITVWLLSFFFLSLRNSSEREGEKRIKSKKEGKNYEGKEEEGEKREEERGKIINSMFSLKEILNKITNLKDYESLMWKHRMIFFNLYKKPVIKTTHYVIPYIWFSLCAPSCSTLCEPMDCSLTGSSLLFFPAEIPGDLPDPGIKSANLLCHLLCRWALHHWSTWETPWEAQYIILWEGKIIRTEIK